MDFIVTFTADGETKRTTVTVPSWQGEAEARELFGLFRPGAEIVSIKANGRTSDGRR